MVAQLCEYAKSHWIVYLKWVNYTVCVLYLNKVVVKNYKNCFFSSRAIKKKKTKNNKLWTRFGPWSVVCWSGRFTLLPIRMVLKCRSGLVPPLPGNLQWLPISHRVKSKISGSHSWPCTFCPKLVLLVSCPSIPLTLQPHRWVFICTDTTLWFGFCCALCLQ